MYYHTLLTIIDKLPKELIESFDLYLARLTINQKQQIDISHVSIKLGIEYEVAEKLLNMCHKIKLVKKYPVIMCPVCERKIEETNYNNLYSDLKKDYFCSHCDEEELNVTTDNVYIFYKLLKKPDPNFNNKKNIEKKNNTKSIENKSFTQKILLSTEELYDFLYSPSEKNYDEMTKKLNSIDANYENTTDKGTSLNDLIIYLLNRCNPFKATKLVITETNQFDCTVVNEIYIDIEKVMPKESIGKISFLNEMGSIFLCECKNEEKTPKGTYFQKLHSILVQNKLTFGIIFSKFPPPTTYKILARETYLTSNIIIISIDKIDLEKIIIDKKNFFEIIKLKIIEVKTNSTTDLSSTELI